VTSSLVFKDIVIAIGTQPMSALCFSHEGSKQMSNFLLTILNYSFALIKVFFIAGFVFSLTTIKEPTHCQLNSFGNLF
jgi:hypothetical protein